jgi:hypothetical protein
MYNILYIKHNLILTDLNNDNITNITPTSLGINFINNLNPVDFSWKDDTVNKHHGFKAQDIYDNLSTYNFYGCVQKNNKLSLNLLELIGPIVKAIKDIYTGGTLLPDNIITLPTTVINLQTQINELITRNANLQTLVNEIIRVNSNLQTQINQINTTNANLQTQINEINTTNANLQTQINQINTTNANLQTQINEINNRIDTSIFNRLNSNDINKIKNWTDNNIIIQGSITITHDNGNLVFRNTNFDTGNYIYLKLDDPSIITIGGSNQWNTNRWVKWDNDSNRI